MKHQHLYASLAISASLVLGACSQQAQYTGGAELERSIVTMVRLAHPVIAEKDGGTDLSDFSLKNLSHFASTNDVGYGDVILFDKGANVTPERIEALKSWFMKQGVTVGETDGVFGSVPAADNVTVYVERYVVTAPDCQRWTETSSMNPNNAPGQPFGCTSQSNLAAMVANPRDLVTGERGGNNADTAVKPVSKNRLKPVGGGN